MNLQVENTADILDRHISGFRQYRFAESVRLTFISQNLCDMTGYTKEELESTPSESYAHLIFPPDRALYESFLEEIMREGRSASAEYRIRKKDGSLLFVRDTSSTFQKSLRRVDTSTSLNV